MLLIAQPKSAGTSLVTTIADILKIEKYEGIARKKLQLDCEGFSEIQKYHSNMIERTGPFLDNATKSKYVIYREHLLPTKRHLKLLEILKRKVIILLRDCEHSLDCYMRMPKGKTFDREELLSDIISFNNTYLEWGLYKKYVLIISYEDLIEKYQKTMNDIFNFWNLKKPKRFPGLAKRNFTGIGKRRLCS